MKDMKKYVRKNKKKIAIIVIGVILLIFLLYMFKVLFIGKSRDAYGNRLDGIKEVKVKEDTKNDTKNQIKETSGVQDVEFILKGKLITYLIQVEEINGDQVKDMAAKTLEKYSEDQLKFYDFQFIVEKDNGADKTAVIGYKNKGSEAVVWSNNLQ